MENRTHQDWRLRSRLGTDHHSVCRHVMVRRHLLVCPISINRPHVLFQLVEDIGQLRTVYSVDRVSFLSIADESGSFTCRILAGPLLRESLMEACAAVFSIGSSCVWGIWWALRYFFKRLVCILRPIDLLLSTNGWILLLFHDDFIFFARSPRLLLNKIVFLCFCAQDTFLAGSGRASQLSFGWHGIVLAYRGPN